MAKAAARRPAPAPRKPTRVRPPARTKKAGVGAQIGRLIAAIPISPEAGKRIRNWSLGLIVGAGICGGLIAMAVPQTLGMAFAHTVGAMGFTVKSIEVVGRQHADRDAIYRIALDARGQDMPLVDLSGIRQALIDLPWVQDARVSRRLPDTLVIDVVEKAPAGIWQYQQRLQLIDADGEPIAALDSQIIPDQLPLVIGLDANRHVAGFQALIASQPAIKPLVEGATWVGQRRWDLLFTTGETLQLPEGDKEAQAALAMFAHKDAEAHLLGKGIVRFDMRDPSRIVAKMSQEPGFKVDHPTPAPAAAPAPTTAPVATENAADGTVT